MNIEAVEWEITNDEKTEDIGVIERYFDFDAHLYLYSAGSENSGENKEGFLSVEDALGWLEEQEALTVR